LSIINDQVLSLASKNSGFKCIWNYYLYEPFAKTGAFLMFKSIRIRSHSELVISNKLNFASLL